MTTIASQITSITVVYSIVYSGADQRKHQSSASLAFGRGFHWDRWIPRTNGQWRGKCFHLMTSSWKTMVKAMVKIDTRETWTEKQTEGQWIGDNRYWLRKNTSVLHVFPLIRMCHDYVYGISWWCHRIESFSALLALYERNSPVTGEFPPQRPVTWNFLWSAPEQTIE